MKTLLVTTDFSAPANNAIYFALELAKVFKANLTLCHAFMVPTEIAMVLEVDQPLFEYSAIKEEKSKALTELAATLTSKSLLESNSFQPLIDFKCVAGDITDIVIDLFNEWEYEMVIMGMSGANALKRFFMGSNSLKMIEKASFPLLLIPANSLYNGFKKIVFATNDGDNDLKEMDYMQYLAQTFNADLKIININEVSMADDVDLMVMVHYRNNLIDRLFNASHTQKLAKHIKIPLLVLPGDAYPDF